MAQDLPECREIALHAGSPADCYKPSAQQQKFCVHLEHLSTRGLYFSVPSSRMCSKFTFALLALARVVQLGLAVLQAFLQLRLEAAVLQRRNCSLRDCLAWGVACLHVLEGQNAGHCRVRALYSETGGRMAREHSEQALLCLSEILNAARTCG